jgi:hypothetical protein
MQRLINSNQAIKMNGAIEMRRRKHSTIIANMIRLLPESKIDSIISQASGLDMVLASKARLAEMADKLPEPRVPSSVMIATFIQDEKLRQRDNKEAITPKGTFTLRDIAGAVAHEELARYRSAEKSLPLNKKTNHKSPRKPKGRDRAAII